MSEPYDHPDDDQAEPEDPAAARLRLDVAIDQLLNDGQAQLDRDAHARIATTYEANRAHLGHIRYLRHRLDQATARGDIDGADRARCGMTQAGARHRTRLAALRHARAAVPSLLDQLIDQLPGSNNTDHATGASGAHRSALALGVLDLLADIQRHTGNRNHQTLAVDVRTWANTTTGTHAAEIAEQWVETGRAILDPPKRWNLGAAAECPACGAVTARVWDNGEPVLRPALELDRSTASARCLCCPARWDKNHLPLLARVLEAQHAKRGSRAAGSLLTSAA